jgi:hypothetical protein
MGIGIGMGMGIGMGSGLGAYLRDVSSHMANHAWLGPPNGSKVWRRKWALGMV